MRNDYLQNALKVIDDPNILVNVVSRRVKQLKRGYRPLIESLEKLSPEDTALREVAEGKITYTLATPEDLARTNRPPVRNTARSTTFQAASDGPRTAPRELLEHV
jgi:DNA-directed RNA polymerase subunit omega